jgi:transposase-like protein
MTTREIAEDSGELYGAEISADLMSAVTDWVLEEVAACRAGVWMRPTRWCSSARSG